MEFLENFFNYLATVDPNKLLRVFWFFFFFEFFRYFVVDLVAVSGFTLGRRLKRAQFENARERLYIEAPLVSILVPGKNEGKHIYELALSLKEQTYQNLEIIIIDDGSTDETPEICRNLKKHGYIDLFIRNDVRGGKASAANLAFRLSRGKYIVHLDADCSYEPDAIEKIILPFIMDDDLGAVGGNVQVKNYKASLAANIQALEYIDTIAIGRMATSWLGLYRMVSGAFGAFRRDVIAQIGAWDIGPGLDGDISVKVRKIGYKVVFEPEAMCYTNVPETFKGLAKQRMRWDKSLIRFRLRKHRSVYVPDNFFSFSLFISFVENVTYNLVLNIKWYVYIIDMLINFTSQLAYIVPMNLLLYTLNNYIKYILFSLYRTRKHIPVTNLLIYIPLVVLYFGWYLRVIRTIAYIKEIFFKASYKDPWNPEKTSKFAKAMNI